MMIRPVTPEELAGLEPLAEEFYASSAFLKKFDMARFVEFWVGFLENGLGAFFGLFDEGKPVGAIAGLVYPEPYSGDLVATEFFWYVGKQFRRGTGGVRLYREFERWAIEKGCTQIRMVHLMDSMPEEVARFYRKLGFKSIETHYAKDLT